MEPPQDDDRDSPDNTPEPTNKRGRTYRLEADGKIVVEGHIIQGYTFVH